jgi:hypothetical protein
VNGHGKQKNEVGSIMDSWECNNTQKGVNFVITKGTPNYKEQVGTGSLESPKKKSGFALLRQRKRQVSLDSAGGCDEACSPGSSKK